MCLLIVLRGVDPRYPLVVASNRDEQRTRYATPPTLYTQGHRLQLAPRDARAGGTWLAVDARGHVAGLTNITTLPRRTTHTSRGLLPHLALDAPDLEQAATAVEARVRREPFNPFQLVLASPDRTLVLRHDGEHTTRLDAAATLVVSNEHAPDELTLPDLPQALATAPDAPTLLDHLAPLLLDRGERSGHRILKHGDDYGTVSSSLLAIPRDDPTRLIWRFAAGPPDEAPYRNYGNLGRRLVGD